MVLEAFASHIYQLLCQEDHVLSQLEKEHQDTFMEVNGPIQRECCSLMQFNFALLDHFLGWEKIAEVIAKVSECESSAKVACVIIDSLFDLESERWLVATEPSSLFTIEQTLFAALRSYVDILTHWLITGELRDKYQEFFLQRYLVVWLMTEK